MKERGEMPERNMDEVLTITTEVTREEAESYLNLYSTYAVQPQNPGVVAIRKFTEQLEAAIK
jgi:hypothetical protein